MKTKHKSIIITSVGISVIVIGFLLVVFVPDPNYHIPRPNPYVQLFEILLPLGILISIGGIVFGIWKKRK